MRSRIKDDKIIYVIKDEKINYVIRVVNKQININHGVLFQMTSRKEKRKCKS